MISSPAGSTALSEQVLDPIRRQTSGHAATHALIALPALTSLPAPATPGPGSPPPSVPHSLPFMGVGPELVEVTGPESVGGPCRTTSPQHPTNAGSPWILRSHCHFSSLTSRYPVAGLSRSCRRDAFAYRHTGALILASMNAPAPGDSETPTGGLEPMRVVEDPLNRETIDAITQLIVERFQPEQIILFGSVARGEEDDNSDLDLMVVLRHNDEQGRDGYAIRLAIAENFVLPVDILIRSADVLARYRQDPNSMLSRMLEDSEVLYDRPAA